MKIARYLLILICFIPLILFRDFTPNNELKYLSIANEALRDGHIFTFWNHGMVYADKPPLYLWIVMLGKWVLGAHYMFFLCLFSILPALVILYIMDKWVKKFISQTQRNSAQLTLITSGLFIGSAIVLRMDMLMCMFIVLALYSFYKIYSGEGNKYESIKLPVYIFLAIFTKGPIGVLVPLLSIISFLILKKQIRHFSKYLGWKQFSILLGLCALWFGCVYLEGGDSYLNNLLFNQTVNRAIDSFHHKEPVWYYLKTIWYSLAPYILFYLAAIIIGVRKHLLNNDLKKFFFIIITTTFIALSLFSAKLDIYMLPIFPFVAYLSFLLLPDISEKYLRITIALPATILCLAFPGILITVQYLPQWMLEIQTIPILIGTLILTLCSIISLYLLLHKKLLLPAMNTLAIGLLLTILTSSFSIPSINEYIGFQKMSRKGTTIAQQNDIKNYYFYPFRSGENLDVYLNQSILPIEIPELSSLIGKQKFILFVRNKELNRNHKLIEISKDKESYRFGDYSIIIFKIN